MNRTMSRYKLAACALCLLSATMLAACNSENGSNNRQVIEKPGKTITVIKDNKEIHKPEQIAIGSMDKINDMRAIDWISEDEALVTAENRNMEPISIEGQESYPNNLYVYDLKSGSMQPLKEERVNQGFAQVSPDRKHIFYFTHVEETATAYMMNLETNQTVELPGGGDAFPYGGSWTQENTVIYATDSGHIYEANPASGEAGMVFETGDAHIYNVVKVGSTIYYVLPGDNSKLKAVDLGTKKVREAGEGIIWFYPAPNESKFAVVRRISDAEMALYMTATPEEEGRELSRGTQVYGTSWSPDSAMIAYSVMSESGGLKGLYAASAMEGQVTQLSVDVTSALIDPIRFSPSGKKLVTATTDIVDSIHGFVSYYIQLK